MKKEPRQAPWPPTSSRAVDFVIPALLVWAICMMILALLGGCADSSTHGTEKDIKTTMTFNVSGNSTVTITSPLSLESATEQNQDTAGRSTVSPTTRLQLTEGGSSAAAEGSTLRDVASTLKQKLDSDNVTKTKKTTDTTTNQSTPTTEVKDDDKEPNAERQADTGKEEASDDIDFKNKATFTSYGVRNGGRQAWRISGKGPSFGQPIKFVFASGKTFTVKDTSKNCRDREDTCERDLSAEMYGFVFKPGIGPNGDGDSDTGTSHGGIYLHAPYGDSSTTVSLYYNKP